MNFTKPSLSVHYGKGITYWSLIGGWPETVQWLLDAKMALFTLQKCFEDFKNLKIKRTSASLITDTPLVSINGVSTLKMTKW